MKKIYAFFPILCLVATVRAQNVGIGTTAPKARLHVADSAVLFTGPPTGPSNTNFPPPAQGEGTRMMWYPEKAAFRAGFTGGDTWDFAKTGLYSFATGFTTTASGNSSTAIQRVNNNHTG